MGAPIDVDAPQKLQDCSRTVQPVESARGCICTPNEVYIERQPLDLERLRHKGVPAVNEAMRRWRRDRRNPDD